MFLSIRKVAERYSVTEDCIRKWVNAGNFPQPVKLNGATRWKIEALEAWEKSK